ncbi:phosphoribosylformylglycinamidine cyclo-ligase [Anaplasmataceae bacterium AB001_6]|nr:phosphoribosylformylglycinamidine cyclo-ligase [Anaplasmataceae bacterium AB001_6]
MSIYKKIGVSPTKTDVKFAIKNQDKGLFPGAFCKIVDDIIYNNKEEYCSIMHSDGAGTKSALAYLYFRETDDLSVFRGIAQDSAVMNIDDIICVGAVDQFFLSNTIGRNAHIIDKNILSEVIEGYEDFSNKLKKENINLIITGGETADLGDLVRTITVDSTVFTRMKKKDVIDASNIKSGNVIIALSSSGKSIFEDQENSGIGSNGLTRARHILLNKTYADKYPETFSPTIDAKYAYQGSFTIDDKLPGANNMTIGEALLSPTRTYAPLIKKILSIYKEKIYSIIHCSGGGLTKSINFGKGLHYIKDNPITIPPIFETILETGKISIHEAFQVFNMGQRMEIYIDENTIEPIIQIAQEYNIDAKVIGYVDTNKDKESNKISIFHNNQELQYYLSNK